MSPVPGPTVSMFPRNAILLLLGPGAPVAQGSQESFYNFAPIRAQCRHSPAVADTHAVREFPGFALDFDARYRA